MVKKVQTNFYCVGGTVSIGNETFRRISAGEFVKWNRILSRAIRDDTIKTKEKELHLLRNTEKIFLKHR